EICLKKLDPLSAQPKQTAPAANESDEPPAPAPVVNDSEYIPKQTKRKVWHRANSRCEFVDSETQRRCNSQHLLETDHIIPRSKGGPNKIEKLRLLCRTDNLHEEERKLGKGLMRSFYNRPRPRFSNPKQDFKEPRRDC